MQALDIPQYPGLQVAVTYDPQVQQWLHEQIKTFNNQHSPHHQAIRTADVESLAIILNDADGAIIGGLSADFYWGWLEINNLWLSTGWRRRGLGRLLVSLAEAEAQRRGCRRAWLRTFSFQAPDFYQRLGYRIVGQLEDYPPGSTFYWLRKDFPVGQAETR